MYEMSGSPRSSPCDQGVDAVVDREDGAADEGGDGGEQRPDVALGAVAEGVVLVGGLLAALEGGEQQQLGDGVGDRVGGLGEHRAGSADDAGDGLGERDPEVGDGGDDDGEDALAAAVVVLCCVRFCHVAQCADQRAGRHQVASGSAPSGDADHALLDHRHRELSVLRADAGLAEAAPAGRRRRLLVVQEPFVRAERAVEPHRVVERGPDDVADRPAAAAVREQHRVEQRHVGDVRGEADVQQGVVGRACRWCGTTPGSAAPAAAPTLPHGGASA